MTVGALQPGSKSREDYALPLPPYWPRPICTMVLISAHPCKSSHVGKVKQFEHYPLKTFLRIRKCLCYLHLMGRGLAIPFKSSLWCYICADILGTDRFVSPSRTTIMLYMEASSSDNAPFHPGRPVLYFRTPSPNKASLMGDNNKECHLKTKFTN